MAFYDVIIKNGTVFDGSGKPGTKKDIGIRGDEISFVGDLSKAETKEIIDASDLFVCPGFIDLTNHSDVHWTLFSNPHQESLIRQGITTVVGGSCGSSIAPLVKGTGIKDIAKWTDITKININWQTMGELFKELEKYGLGLNFATFTGLNTLQYEILGYRDKPLTDEEFKEMKFLLESSIDEGAFGMSTNFAFTQSQLFQGTEIIEYLFRIIEKKKGITKHHLEDEGVNILPAISHLINLSRKTGCPLHLSHFKVLGKSAWAYFEDALKMIRNARKEGLKITCDLFPYDRTGSNLFALMPSWLKKMHEDEIMEILNNKREKRRKEIIDHLKKLTLHYDRIIVAASFFKAGNVGKTIAELSRSSELTPEEVVLNLLENNKLKVSIFSQVINPAHLLELVQEDYMAFSSDSVGYDANTTNNKDLPHPRSFGAFPRCFRLFVKENEILSWGTAIHRATGLPASILRINDRGIIAKNKKADIIIFDPEKLLDYATYDNPERFSKGIGYVFINGEKVLSNDLLTGKFAGRVLKKK